MEYNPLSLLYKSTVTIISETKSDRAGDGEERDRARKRINEDNSSVTVTLLCKYSSYSTLMSHEASISVIMVQYQPVILLKAAVVHTWHICSFIIGPLTSHTIITTFESHQGNCKSRAQHFGSHQEKASIFPALERTLWLSPARGLTDQLIRSLN